MKILNLYAGIGGNRKHWDGDKHNITAVEINQEIAEEYRKNFPKDNVVVGDAHEYLKNNYRDFDFIWSSPPCPTHSSIRKAGVENGQYDAKYPDMKLWQEILFLDQYFRGDYVVENVKPFYDEKVNWEMLVPQESGQHYLWSNYAIPDTEIASMNHNNGNCSKWQQWLGIQVKDSWRTVEKRKVLRNCVHPKIGEKILKARNTKQTKLKVGSQ